MAQLQKGTTYITGDQVTAANLNALVDSGILTPGAVTDQTAKTVPLAADTILLHSAADTALRKTTMTQLFATPQPLGATTPSSVAATTGTFSSTLGVTGVATLGNGAILGTPASGTVTNLTGTASININGTVGATTPSTGVFTAAKVGNGSTNYPELKLDGPSNASGAVLLQSASANKGILALSNYILGGTAQDLMLYSNANNIVFYPSGALAATLSSTGFDVKTYIYSTQAIASGGNYIQVFNPSDTGGDNTRYAGINFVVGSDSGTSAIRSYRTNSATNYETALAFLTNPSGATQTPTEKMRITSTGNVGIGTASPAVALDVNGVINTNNELRLTGNGKNLTFSNSTSGITHQLSSDSSGNLNLSTASTTVYQNLYASGNRYHYFVGNVGIGQASPSQRLHITGSSLSQAIALENTGSGGKRYDLISSSSGSGYGSGSFVIEDQAVGARLMINSSGNVLIGATTTPTGAADGVQLGSAQSSRVFSIASNASSNQILFYSLSGLAGYISTNTLTTSYVSISDYRLKNTITPMMGALAKVALLKPVTYKWNIDDSNGEGFVAHELAEVVPYAVSGEKDGEQMQGVDYGKITPLLAAAIQELSARLAALESK